MEKKIRFGNARFDPSYYDVVRDDGLQVSFTKTERLILLELTRNPHTVYSRDQLLDTISGQGSDASDRNIDFAINRIRKKLGDSARNPEYIATYYGEGYAWISNLYSQSPSSTGAYIVVGPIRGLRHTDEYENKALEFSKNFQLCIKQQMRNDQKVVLDPQCPSPSEFSDGCPKFSIDLHFLKDSRNLNCVFTVKSFERGNVLMVVRKTLASETQSIDPEIIEKLAGRALNAIWRSYINDMSVSSLPDSPPLHIGLFDASNEFDCERGNWENNYERLKQAVLDDGSDAVAKLVLATNIHLKYIQDKNNFTILGPDTRVQDEDEIETLVLACLPHVQSNGVLLLATAKLLFFLDRGYRQLAVELAESAFKNSTAIASSLAIVGQMRMFLGEFEQAIDFIEQAQNISKEGTQFHYYLLFIKCQTYLAEGNWSKLREALDDIFKKVPEASYTVSIFFASAGGDKVQPESEAMAKTLSREQAVAILKLTNYVYARLFTENEPRVNIFKGLTSLMIKNFGMDIIPNEIREAVPTLFKS